MKRYIYIGIKSIFLLLGFVLNTHWGMAQDVSKKNVNAMRCSAAIKVDGEMNEAVWKTASVAGNFSMREPNPGKPATEQSDIRVVYDDVAMYVFAKMYDANPSTIAKELTPRDQLGNTDYLAVVIDAYKDGQNGVGFVVTPRGVQYDVKYFPSTSGGEDASWNAVWDCSAKVTAEGWVAEFAIPYAAIRFPNIAQQSWGINFIRKYTKNRETSAWNEINPAVNGFLNQCGTLSGIENIKPPIRLSATPFLAAYAQDYYDKKASPAHSFGKSISGGMDIKYGINDAFTVDMTVIPDFGQVQSDSKLLNLTPYEVRFDENRPFFTEGVELFQKGGLLYSRRIGSEPLYYGKVNNLLNSNERIVSNPATAQLYNATKLSGRTKNGLGIGLLNSIAAASFATAEDEGGNQRRIKTGDLTNYNMMVFDQNLKNNSSVTLINTNVFRNGKDYDANVTGLEYNLRNKQNSFSISGGASASQRFFKDSLDLGHKWRLNLSKLGGSHTYGVGYNEESVQYNPNDLGFLRAPNERSWSGYYIFNKYKPFGKFNKFNLNNFVDVGYLYKPFAYSSFNLSGNFFFLTKKIFAFGGNYNLSSLKTHDYFEPRTNDFKTYYAVPEHYGVGGFISTDYRKILATDVSLNYNVWDEKNRWNVSLSFRPRARLSEHFFILGNFGYTYANNEVGFVSKRTTSIGYTPALNNKIILGVRDQRVFSNVVTTRYAFNNAMSLNLRVRHYWANVRYSDFKTLGNKGILETTDYQGKSTENTDLHDTDYNLFNVDVVYLWRFAPGSDLSVVWKNEIGSFANRNNDPYFRTIAALNDEPQSNSFSVKMLYFLDYSTFRKRS